MAKSDIKPKKPKKKPPMSQAEMAKALGKMQDYSSKIIEMFNENKENANMSLSCTLIAAVGIARNGGSDYETFMKACSETWANVKEKPPEGAKVH